MTTIQLKIPVLLDLIFVCPLLLLRLLKFGYTYRRIPLGEDRFALVDPLIFYRLNKFHWFIDGKKKCMYAVRRILSSNSRSTILRMHREIMNAPAGLLVDHKNNNTLDNRRANLRLATHSQNMQNRGKLRSNTSSQFIGVYFDKISHNWNVQIRHQGKRMFIGRFDSEIDAARAYDHAAREYHKEFARLNFS